VNRLSGVSERIRRSVSHFPAVIAARWKNNFYIYLATLFSLFIGVDALFLDRRQVLAVEARRVH
jgi:hypothetical protein